MKLNLLLANTLQTQRKTLVSLLFVCTYHLLLSSATPFDSLPNRSIDPNEALRNLQYGRFYNPSIEAGSALLRDRNLSPLFYSGPYIHIGQELLWANTQWQHRFGIGIGFAQLSAQLAQADFMQQVTGTMLFRPSFYSEHLYQVPAFKRTDYHLYVGGVVKGNFDVRINSSLFNNAFSSNGFLNLALGARLQKEISRTSDRVKQKKSGITKVKYARFRSLSVQTDIGLINLNYLPGYTNIYRGAIDSKAEGGPGLFSQYETHLNGWRLDAKLEYQVLKTNGNGYKIGFVSHNMSAKGAYKPVDIATTTLQFTLIVNNNKK